MIPTLKSIFNFNQWKQVQQWVNNKLTLKQDIFNANNTATGVSTVTINAKSGVATFTSTIIYNESLDFTINNNLVTDSSIISLNLKSQSTGSPTISKYSTTNGIISIRVLNANDSNGDNTDDNLIISFQILN